jgi:hypothetical protein
MKYQTPHNIICGQAFDFLNGRDVFNLLLAIGAAEVHAASAFGGSVYNSRQASVAPAFGCIIVAMAFAACQVSVGMALWSVLKLSSIIYRKTRRPTYYLQENRRRQQLARQRRRVRNRFTVNPCPKPQELIEQYGKAKTGTREALKFGSMLCDLEAYCDNSLQRNVFGEIAGRNAGIKGWLKVYCPQVAMHYSNAMRYKQMAERFRQVVGTTDPLPVEMLTESDDTAIKQLLKGGSIRKITVRNKKDNGVRNGKIESATFILEAEKIRTAWQTAQEILQKCEDEKNAGLRCGIKDDKQSGKGQEQSKKAKQGDKAKMLSSGMGKEDGTGKENEKGKNGLRGGRRSSVAALEDELARRLGEGPRRRKKEGPISTMWRMLKESTGNNQDKAYDM